MLPIILGHEPGGTSTRTVIHFAQEVNSGKFSKFDFGPKGNMKEYGKPTPPEYRLDRATVPVALMWSENDWLADPQVKKKSPCFKQSICESKVKK
jgi:lysosomal acid lipase/cholesteryl ester hydrolase